MKFSSLDSQNALSMTSMPGVFEQVAFFNRNSFISGGKPRVQSDPNMCYK